VFKVNICSKDNELFPSIHHPKGWKSVDMADFPPFWVVNIAGFVYLCR
jgi:hypothetical protein